MKKINNKNAIKIATKNKKILKKCGARMRDSTYPIRHLIFYEEDWLH